MRKKKINLRLKHLLELVPDKLRAPLGIIMGGSRDVAEFVAERNTPGDVCYQMDLFQSEQLRDDLLASGTSAEIVTRADLWDLPTPLQTLVYPVLARGERSLKLDLVEQAYHILRPQGTLLVLASEPNDPLFQQLLKKNYGKFHVAPEGKGFILWAQRQEDKPRRRHEISFHVQQPEGPSLKFVSRPGVFSYGKFDHGARALVELMDIQPNDKILDVGCGCGTIGIQAGLRAGLAAEVVFVDSNLRALALAELNAQANGLTNFRTVARSKVENIDTDGFDVALANPPYFAQNSIARLFVERSKSLLKPGGRFYLVTKQHEALAEIVTEFFTEAEVALQRGYTIFAARV